MAKKSQQEIADLIGEKRSTYAEWERNIIPKANILLKIADVLSIPIQDLLGVDDKSDSRTSYMKDRQDIKSIPKTKAIPFYDADASASDITVTEMNPIYAPAGTIDVGDLLHDSEAAIRIYGNSMLPNYPPGCVVGLNKVSKTFIEPGEVYVIETRERRLLKRLFYKNDEDEQKLTCYSDNTMKFENGARHGKLAYPPFDLPKDEIINLFAVTGVIKRNTNSIIINR